MPLTRRAFQQRCIAGAPVLASLASACAPGQGLPLPSMGPKVIHVAAFLGQDPTILSGAERAPLEMQRAANWLNQQKPGYEVKVDFMLLPPRAPSNPGSSAAPAPTPQAPTAQALEQAGTSGELAAGSPPPDLALITTPADLPVLLERKLIQPLDEVLRTNRLFSLEEFAPGALDAVRARGRLGMLPLAGQVNTLLFDQALFESGGVKPPDREWTWNALVEAGRRLTQATGDSSQWGIMAHNQLPLLLSLLWSYGGEVLSKDGRRAALTDPAAREGIQFWADLFQRHRIAPVPPPGMQIVQSAGPNEIGLMHVESSGSVASMAVRVTSEIGAASTGGGRIQSIRDRAAMLVSPMTISTIGGLVPMRRSVVPTDLPKARQRATPLTLSAGLALGAQARDTKLALTAAHALAERLQQSPLSVFGYPVRKPDAASLRRVQTQLTDEDAATITSALGYSRALPPEWASSLTGILQSRLMAPVVSGQATLDEAIRSASSAIDDLLRG